jgi:hypothetical protein
MKRWMWLAVRLYPQAWRERYGDEFAALVEDVQPGLREFADVVLGALKMHMLTANTYVKLSAAMALAGALVAAGVSFTVPQRYVASATVWAGDAMGDEAARRGAFKPFVELLSRSNLASIIQDPALDLYKGERQRQPMEDVVVRMRRDIRLSALATLSPDRRRVRTAVGISFAYPDEHKAEAVMRRLVPQYAAAARALTVEPAVRPAIVTLPDRSRHLVFAVWGLGAGLLLGLLAAFMMRRRRQGA